MMTRRPKHMIPFMIGIILSTLVFSVATRICSTSFEFFQKPMKLLFKRGFDIVVSVLAIIVFAPIMLMTALLVRITMGSPILFRQARPGLNGVTFTMVKFRTMSMKHDQHHQLLPDEMRLTRLGQFLRKTSIDELPELFNVLRGEMSIVGPRPLLISYLNRYSPTQARRHEVKPGITGWAQINGRNSLSWDEKLKLDVWYVDNNSIMLDIKIIMLTVRKVLKREGISQEGHATMPEFTGSAVTVIEKQQFSERLNQRSYSQLPVE